MEKHSISSYAWIIVVVTILVLMIGVSAVIGGRIGNGTEATLGGMQSAIDYAFAEPYTVEVLNNISDAGTVSIEGYDDTSVELKGEQTLTLAATENFGYKFAGWYEGDTLLSNANPYTYTTKSSDVQVTAVYEEYIEPGLYETGTNTLKYSWDELLANNIVMASGGGYATGEFGPTAAAKTSLAGDLVLPEGIDNVPQRAYYGCNGLTSVCIPEGVTSIGSGAFNGCTKLTSVVIPDSVTSIGGGAFWGCSSLTNIEIPDSITTIDYNTFRECSSLTSAIIPSSVTSIGDRAYYGCNSLSSVEIPNSVISIGQATFSNCAGLTTVFFEENSQLTSIGVEAFSGSRKLTSIEIPDSVTSIGSEAFYYCSGLTNVVIGNGVTNIAEETFYGCSGLTSIEIPDSVTSIGNDAFHFCSNLTSIVIPDSVTSIGSNVFLQGNIKTITLPAELLSKVPLSVETVIISSGTEIAQQEFYGYTDLTSVVIPDSVTSIGAAAFRDCSSLTSVVFGENSQLTSIGDGAFRKCSSLTDIVIPDSVTYIGSSAFWDCTNISKFNYQGTIAEWNAITIGSTWNVNTSEYTIYCTDGTIAKDGTVTMK